MDSLFTDEGSAVPEAIPPGFSTMRYLGDGRWLGVMPQLWGVALLGITTGSRQSFDDVWEYENEATAMLECGSWDPTTSPEPEGWTRHPHSGRRRPDGDPQREYINP